MATTRSAPPLSAAASARLQEQFRQLAAEWHQATAHLSSMSAASRHPAYQAIVSLGSPVIPLLLRDMFEHETHWFVALHSISGADPIAENVAGNIPAMIEAWLRWAKDQGIQW